MYALLKKGNRGVFFLSIFLLLNSCGSASRNSISKDLDFEIAISEVETVSIELDSVTSNYASFYQHRVLGGIPYLIVRNYPEQSILFFNLKSKLLEKRIAFEKQGPNRIVQPKGIYVHNIDSIFVSDYVRGVILINGNGEVITKYEIGYDPGLGEFDGIVSMRSGNAISILDDIMIYANPGLSYQDKSIELIDLKNNDVKESLRFPEIYQDHKLEGIWYERIYSDIMQSKDKIVIGFNLATELYFIDKNGEVTTKKPSIGEICTDCHYYDYTADSKFLTISQHQKIVEHYFTNYSFLNVMYDDVNNLIYRVLKAPTSSTDFETLPEPRKFEVADYYIMAFEADTMKYLGTFKLNGKDYWISPDNYFIFVSQGMIYVARRDGREDEFLFDIYKIKNEKITF